MSWIDKIKNDLVIITGDSERYSPSWLNASFVVEYNIAQFEFPQLPGSLVKRGTPLGTKYSLEIYFQGDDHLDTAKAFRKSADDIRAWTLEHPLYGTLTVQPFSLSYDNTKMNVTKITGIIMETIVEDNPKTTIDPIDSITVGKADLDIAFEKALTATPSPGDINTMALSNSNNRLLGVKVITIPEEAENYLNLFNTANAYINTATASPLLAMRTTIAMITAPAKFTASVQSRMQLLGEQFALLQQTIVGITSVSSKQIYQNHGGTFVSAMALAAATPLPGNYTNANSALNSIDLLLAAYAAYLASLDAMQSSNGGSPNSFIPSADPLIGLNNLVNLTVSSLFTIALSSKKERSIITEEDTNAILLTHRFYGLDPSDANLDEFIANNNIGLNQLLQIKKGTKVVYYI